MESELDSLQSALAEALDSGTISMYSSEWYDMQESINAVTESIQEATTSLVEYANAMRELDWDYFDYVEDQISNLTSEADFLIDLMSNTDLYTDNGQLTDTGISTMGLHAQNYDTYMYQADDYAEQIEELNEAIADDPFNTDLLERRQELLELQQESILAAEEEKQAIVDMVEEGIELELSALQDLIDQYENSLDSAKDLYDYQKSISDQTSEIASLQKQLSAYSTGNDTSEETRATVQKLQVSLEEAETELAEMQYEQFISDTKQMLDNLYDEYELILNQRLDDIDLLISDMITAVNANAITINDTLLSQSEAVGYTMSTEMSNIWQTASDALRELFSELGIDIENATTLNTDKMQELLDSLGIDIDDATLSVGDMVKLYQAAVEQNGKDYTTAVTTYGPDFSDKQTTTNQTLDSIKAYVAAMQQASDTTAAATVSETKSSSSSSTSSSSSSSSSSSTKSSSNSSGGDGVVAVGDKVTFKSGKYYTDSYGTSPTGSKYLGESVYVTKVVSSPKSGQNYPIHISTGNKLGNGDLGWIKKDQITGYKTGGLVDYTGLAQLDGTPQEPELVLNATDTANFIALKDAMADVANGNTLTALFGDSAAENLLEQLTTIGMPLSVESAGITQDINCTMNVAIDHVEDYNSLVNQMVKDPQFEKFVQAMTVDQAVGGSKLAKNKYKWG